jgi:hypothetical protein
LGPDHPPKNLKDSLLQIYTMEELKEMNLNEFGNAVRIIRGQEPIDYSVLEKTHDDNGIKIVKDIPKGTTEEINALINQIDQEKVNYRQEVFPNTYADILEHYMRFFYKSFIDRDFHEGRPFYKDRLSHLETDTTSYSNSSKRAYYFNKSGNLRLIEVEIGYNVNKGGQIGWVDKLPYIYKKELIYVWNDSLIYYHGWKAEQNLSISDYHMLTDEELDTTKAQCSEAKVYYYKDNGYKLLIKEGEYIPSKWREKLAAQPFEDRGEGSSNGVIWLRNYMAEYEEYHSGENDYLKPVPSSFLEPYVIDSE